MSAQSPLDPQKPVRPFAGLQNKSAEPLAEEAKAAVEAAADPDPDPEPEPEPDAPADLDVTETDVPSATPAVEFEDAGEGTLAVVMVHHHTYDGVPLIPAKAYNLPVQLARMLVANRRANLA